MEPDEDRIAAAVHDDLAATAAESASIAWRRAPETCGRDDAGRRPCLAYHRLWQYLALLGVARSIRSDTGFLIGTFRRLAKVEGARRVLISGAADFAMLAHVLKAFDLEGIEPRVIVVDRCPTPLVLNRWYAERRGALVETVNADVLSYRPDATVDIICTHSFLGWFSPDDKQRLVRSWHSMLVPGGSLVTTQRINRTCDEGIPRTFDDDGVREYQERVRVAAEAYTGPLPATSREMAQVAGEYARSYRRYPTAAVASLREVIAGGGFSTVEIDGETPVDAGMNRPSGPLRGAGNRVRLVARRGV